MFSSAFSKLTDVIGETGDVMCRLWEMWAHTECTTTENGRCVQNISKGNLRCIILIKPSVSFIYFNASEKRLAARS